jgi:hypothetical protein|tara:strand:- start:375 stop:623 length:249 start_codon:yes stop_codon:yes gene_type:complete
LTIAIGASVGATVGAGTAVAPPEGIAVGAIAVGAGAPGTAVGEAGRGVAVADEPQAKIAANNRAKGPRIMILGFFNQCFKIG